jgi:YD repeat-containing protein
MVGETSVTDANGIVVKYDYDVYNRLSMVKDNQDNVLKRYSYHYKGETPGFSIYTSRTQAMVGEDISFGITDIAAARGGTPQFLFDFGDGTIQDNAPTYVSHQYGSAGTYTVKLVGINPEYGPATRTVQVGIYDPLYAYVCENGPVYTDVCGIDPPYYGPCTTPDHEYEWSGVDLTLSLSGGCPSSYTYYWEYSYGNGGWWYQLGSGPNVTFYTPGQGNYQIRCTVTDGCYNTVYAYSYITRYNSSGCPEGFN